MATSLARAAPIHRHRAHRWRRIVLAALLALQPAGVGYAASLQVAPILVELSHGEQAGALWLSNTGDRPIRAQVRVMQWSQIDATEHLEASRGLLPSPPIIEIAAGERQLVRIVRPDAGAVAAEQAFRLLVDELPDPRQPASAGLQFLLQYSIPVFVLPPGATPHDAPGPRPPTDASVLTASLDRRGADTMLTVTNQGKRRVRLSEVGIVDANGVERVLVPGLMGYVLAGQRMQWPQDLPPATAGGMRLTVRLNDDADPQRLPLSIPTP